VANSGKTLLLSVFFLSEFFFIFKIGLINFTVKNGTRIILHLVATRIEVQGCVDPGHTSDSRVTIRDTVTVLRGVIMTSR